MIMCRKWDGKTGIEQGIMEQPMADTAGKFFNYADETRRRIWFV
jgi:hypothetical protein